MKNDFITGALCTCLALSVVLNIAFTNGTIKPTPVVVSAKQEPKTVSKLDTNQATVAVFAPINNPEKIPNNYAENNAYYDQYGHPLPIKPKKKRA